MRKIKIANYNIWKEGNKIVAHAGYCDERGCTDHDATANKREIAILLAGRKRKLGRLSVTYPDKKTIQIGCQSVPRKTVERLAKLLQ